MSQPTTPYKITRSQLLLDLYISFFLAARHKHKMSYVQKFEKNFAENLNQLCDDLLNRTYEALPSKCFIIDYPKKREVFAAMFRDRIVHHLYFLYTHQLFERTFIADSYSCIKGRGTHYGIDRIRQHIRQASGNWQYPCYAMNLDIRGYFMHINRAKLLSIATDTLIKMQHHRVGLHEEIEGLPSGTILTPNTTWNDIRDFDFILWLTEKIIMLDPMKNCIIIGKDSDWDDIDHAKCMRFAEPGIALPIGNPTSQLFSNVYMNPFDQFIKRDIKCQHYGRYVDDSIMIHPDRDWLLAQRPRIREFLADELYLQLHMGKLRINNVRHGVEFLGAFIKPYRDYVSNKTYKRIKQQVAALAMHNLQHANASINSYLGVLSHSASYNIRRQLISENNLSHIIQTDPDFLKVIK